MSNRDKFLVDFKRLCSKYSSNGEWEWRIGSEGEDGIHFKYFYIDIKNTEEKDNG